MKQNRQRWFGWVVAGALTLLAQPLSGQAAPNVVAWGNQHYGFSLSPPPDAASGVVALADGGENAVALRADGTVVSWGVYDYGAVPTNYPSSLTDVLAVAAGPGYALALRGNGTVAEWGADPVALLWQIPANLTNVTAIAAANGGAMALRTDRSAVSWSGYEQYPVPGFTNVVATAGGVFFWLALQPDGTVAASGCDTFGYGMLNIPPHLTNAVAVVAGGYFSLALRADGTVVAWGDNGYGQTNVPPNLTNAVAIAAGLFHCLALRSDGTVVAWGNDNYGQTDVPAGLTNVVGLAAGGYSSMALTGATMPPRQVPVTNVTFGAGGFSAQVPTDRGRVYAVEYKKSLSDAQWTLLPLVTGTGGVVTLSDAAPGPGQRFYRARRW